MQRYNVVTESYYPNPYGLSSVMGGTFVDIIANDPAEAELQATLELTGRGRNITFIKAVAQDVIFLKREYAKKGFYPLPWAKGKEWHQISYEHYNSWINRESILMRIATFLNLGGKNNVQP